MQRIKLLVSRVSSGQSQPYGMTVDVPDDEARLMVESHQAEYIDRPPADSPIEEAEEVPGADPDQLTEPESGVEAPAPAKPLRKKFG